MKKKIFVLTSLFAFLFCFFLSTSNLQAHPRHRAPHKRTMQHRHHRMTKAHREHRRDARQLRHKKMRHRHAHLRAAHHRRSR
ncbi:MAG: hypothetical protein JNM95_12000 [Chitinophagaceae bacterium]|nr:hypothetical protein [Chitinophagaceae bacterium]